MSVIEYTYPASPEQLATGSVSVAFERASPGITLKWERRPRATPDWSAVTAGHPRHRRVESVFVVAKNSAAQKRELATRYEGDASLEIVRRAPIFIWSQLKVPLSAPAAVLLAAMDTHRALVAAISRIGGGVVDLPENERLYSAAAFGRYAKRRLTHPRSGPGRR